MNSLKFGLDGILLSGSSRNDTLRFTFAGDEVILPFLISLPMKSQKENLGKNKGVKDQEHWIEKEKT